MKKICVSSIMGICILLNSCTKTKVVTTSDVNLTNGLIAYYPFNGNAKDSSGNNLNGTIVGGVTFANDVTGNPNSAAAFDGLTGYILVPDNAGKFQTNAVSVSFLVNLTNTAIRQSFIASQNFTDGTGLSYGVLIGTANTNLPQFGVENNTLGCGSPVADPSSAISPANEMSANKWYSIVCIFSDSLQEIFINGVLNTAVTRSFATLNQCLNNKDLVIGAWWSGDLIPVSGSIDELRIYNRTLNQDEVTALAKPVQ